MPHWIDPNQRVVLISDMHMGDGDPTEPFTRKDGAFRRFLAHVHSCADALVIAGDGFDVAQACSLRRIRSNHRRLVDDLIALARVILGPHRKRTFFDWWRAFYRGWFRYDVPAMNRAATLGEDPFS
ncbi:hypothetical protein ACFL59_04285 [Planctomycetota bacterium]